MLRLKLAQCEYSVTTIAFDTTVLNTSFVYHNVSYLLCFFSAHVLSTVSVHVAFHGT